MAKMPQQKPHRSKQDYGTPPEFLTAVRDLLGIVEFDFDLAASDTNAVCPQYYTEADDSLIQPWKVGIGWNWLNPPFSKIRPWVKKAVDETVGHGAKTAMLVPASVGSTWWHDWVHGFAYVHFLAPRLVFVGETASYPKDLALLLYQPPTIGWGGYSTWGWKDK